MASNQYVNKVIFGGDVIMDISSDTVAANKLLSGITAHDKTGAPITGSPASSVTVPRTTPCAAIPRGNRHSKNSDIKKVFKGLELLMFC